MGGRLGLGYVGASAGKVAPGLCTAGVLSSSRGLQDRSLARAQTRKTQTTHSNNQHDPTDVVEKWRTPHTKKHGGLPGAELVVHAAELLVVHREERGCLFLVFRPQ